MRALITIFLILVFQFQTVIKSTNITAYGQEPMPALQLSAPVVENKDNDKEAKIKMLESSINGFILIKATLELELKDFNSSYDNTNKKLQDAIDFLDKNKNNPKITEQEKKLVEMDIEKFTDELDRLEEQMANTQEQIDKINLDIAAKRKEIEDLKK